VRGIHTEFINQYPKEIVYSGSLRGSGEGTKGVKNPLDPLSAEPCYRYHRIVSRRRRLGRSPSRKGIRALERFWWKRLHLGHVQIWEYPVGPVAVYLAVHRAVHIPGVITPAQPAGSIGGRLPSDRIHFQMGSGWEIYGVVRPRGPELAALPRTSGRSRSGRWRRRRGGSRSGACLVAVGGRVISMRPSVFHS
jgi:hypothetical protein